ncbi:hypothetical protein ABIB94_007369 [Bradyrhizobium sp. JR7.2]|uniref:Uncharacterized protein n=1 Tax=Bradyrhizobium barranii TaxID=2992140 RepID=A0ABY3R207_9BRAD|nr:MULTISPECIES: hypothetical protein [Bradyrhizobium]UFW91764.1 hypothetical protein BjapCC829_45800 [Bradyrhizobium japonicum]WFU00287.1 hypothetical protein QA633_46545 [Bradyrhizobium barranii]
MKVIVDETGEIIAIATDDHILVGHHRLAVAGSMGKRLFWREIPANLWSLITSSSIVTAVGEGHVTKVGSLQC